MRSLRPTLLVVMLTMLSAAFPATGQHFCDDPPVLTLLTGEVVSASGLNTEGHPIGFFWYVTPPGGPVPAEPTSRQSSTLVTPDLPGLWSIALEADWEHQAPAGGLWSSETCLTIEAASVVTAINVASAQIATDEPLDVDGHDSRWAAGVVPTVEWQVDGLPLGSCNGGPPPANPGSLNCTIPANWLSPGWHTAGLRLTDPSSGQTSISTADFEVIEIIPLSVDFGWSPIEPDPGQNVHFQAEVLPATPEGEFTRVTWNLGNGTVWIHTSCPAIFGSCLEWAETFATDGWYDVSVTVETADETASKGYRVKIGDPIDPPIASFNLSPPSPQIMDSTTLAFDGECDGTCHWSWDFGDGAQSVEQNPTHTWLIPEIYTVTLSVSNESGNDLTSIPVNVGNCWIPSEPVQEGECFGGPVAITAPPGSAWLWNTGATTRSIPALFGGAHWVDINDGSGCWGHTPKTVSLDNCGDPDGDTDLSGKTDAADLAALVPELTDNDGDAVSDAGGDDLTAPGGDATGDWHLRTDDLLRVLLEVFDSSASSAEQ